MFENLSDKLQRAFKNLRGQGTITEENIGEALREMLRRRGLRAFEAETTAAE